MSRFNPRTMFLGLLGAAMTLGVSAAHAESYVCDITDPGRYNVVPEKVLIELKPDGSALVVDPFLVYMKQAPKKADFVKNTEDLLRVRWRIDDMKFSGGGQRDMRLSLVFRKNRQKAHLTIDIIGADNTDAGNGTCVLAK